MFRLGDGVLILVHALGAAFPNGALGVAHDDVLEPDGHEQLDDRRSGSARAAGHDFDVLDVLAHNLEGIEEARKRHHGGPVLVVMKDRAFKDAARLQAVLDLEALGGLDVLKVHAAERGGHKLHQLDNLGGILGVHAQREGIHVAKPFEQQRFAFHDRHGGTRADVAEPKHGGPVGHHAHEIRMVGVDVEHGGIFVDFLARLGHTGRVGKRQVIVVARGNLDPDVDLADVVLMQGQSFFTEIFDT